MQILASHGFATGVTILVLLSLPVFVVVMAFIARATRVAAKQAEALRQAEDENVFEAYLIENGDAIMKKMKRQERLTTSSPQPQLLLNSGGNVGRTTEIPEFEAFNQIITEFSDEGDVDDDEEVEFT